MDVTIILYQISSGAPKIKMASESLESYSKVLIILAPFNCFHLLKRKLSNLDKYIQSVSEDQNSKILCVSVRDGKIVISGDKPTKSTRFTIQL